MSTKTSIKSSVHTDDQPGFHRLVDFLDDFGVADGAPQPSVYLRIDGVSVQLQTFNAGGATVTVPWASARELGMLPFKDGLPQTIGN